MAVQVTRELLLLTSPVMFTLDLAVTRWLDGHMVRESLSSVRLTPCPADHTWTGRGKTLWERQETVLVSDRPRDS